MLMHPSEYAAYQAGAAAFKAGEPRTAPAGQSQAHWWLMGWMGAESLKQRERGDPEASILLRSIS